MITKKTTKRSTMDLPPEQLERLAMRAAKNNHSRNQELSILIDLLLDGRLFFLKPLGEIYKLQGMSAEGRAFHRSPTDKIAFFCSPPLTSEYGGR